MSCQRFSNYTNSIALLWLALLLGACSATENTTSLQAANVRPALASAGSDLSLESDDALIDSIVGAMPPDQRSGWAASLRSGRPLMMGSPDSHVMERFIELTRRRASRMGLPAADPLSAASRSAAEKRVANTVPVNVALRAASDANTQRISIVRRPADGGPFILLLAASATPEEYEAGMRALQLAYQRIGLLTDKDEEIGVQPRAVLATAAKASSVAFITELKAGRFVGDERRLKNGTFVHAARVRLRVR